VKKSWEVDVVLVLLTPARPTAEQKQPRAARGRLKYNVNR